VRRRRNCDRQAGAARVPGSGAWCDVGDPRYRVTASTLLCGPVDPQHFFASPGTPLWQPVCTASVESRDELQERPSVPPRLATCCHRCATVEPVDGPRMPQRLQPFGRSRTGAEAAVEAAAAIPHRRAAAGLSAAVLCATAGHGAEVERRVAVLESTAPAMLTFAS